MTYIDWAFGLLSGRFGWVVSLIALVCTVGLAAQAWRTSWARKRLWAAVLVGGLVLSAMLAAPSMLMTLRPQAPLGPFKVQHAALALPSADSSKAAEPIGMQIWFPTSAASGPVPELDTCAALNSLRLARAESPRRLILYLPHFWGRRDDNSARLKYLASFGYVIVAFDDVALDRPPMGDTPQEEAARRLAPLDAETPQDYLRHIADNDIRVRLEAQKALNGLDRLTACAAGNPQSPWAGAIDYGHVGFLGYSSGGAAAAEASTMDSRIAAVVNLDGILFGQAYDGRVVAPYLYVLSGRPLPTREAMMSTDPDHRYRSRLEARDMREQARLAARPGSGGVRIEGSEHSSLSDAALEPHASRLWVLKNPIAFYNAVNAYSRAFFDAHLAGRPQAWIDQRASSSPVAKTFKEMGMTPDGNMSWPPQQDSDGAPIP